MSAIHIDAEAYAGTDIAAACERLCLVANRMNCDVHCNFNGVKLIVRPGDTAPALEAAWYKEFHGDRPYKIAVAR